MAAASAPTCRSTGGCEPGRVGSRNGDPPGDLAVALPVGGFTRQQWVVRRWLDFPVFADRAGGDGVLARGRGGPVTRPEGPGERLPRALSQRCRLPGLFVDLDLDASDRVAPRRPHDLVRVVLFGHLGGR